MSTITGAAFPSTALSRLRQFCTRWTGSRCTSCTPTLFSGIFVGFLSLFSPMSAHATLLPSTLGAENYIEICQTFSSLLNSVLDLLQKPCRPCPESQLLNNGQSRRRKMHDMLKMLVLLIVCRIVCPDLCPTSF